MKKLLGAAAAALADGLTDPVEDVRTNTVNGLSGLGVAAKEALPALKEALKGAKGNSRVQLAFAVWRARKLRAFSRLPHTSIEHQARERLRDLS